MNDRLPGLRRRLAMARDLERQRPAWVSGPVEIEETQVSSMSPAEARQAGVDAAAALRDATGVPDDELLARIAEMSSDPYFAAGFAETLPPDQLAEVMLGLADTLAALRSPSSYQGDLQRHEEWLAEVTAWYEPLLESVSKTIGTGTFNTGDLAMPPDYAQSWISAITAEVRSHGGSGTALPDQAGILGQLLGAGGRFEDAFILDVAEGVFEYERAFAAEHGGAVWAPRAPASQPGGQSTARGAAPTRRAVPADPLLGIMSALGQSPVAAQQFFSRGGRTTIDVKGVDVAVAERLQYLVVDRRWSGWGSEAGTELGSALEAATTTFRDRGQAGRTSAQIAGETFALIGENTGRGDAWYKFGTDGWEMPTGLRVHVGNMLQSYGADVFRVAARDRADTDATRGHVAWRDDLSTGVYALDRDAMFPEGEMPYGALLDTDHLKRIVGTLGERESDFEPVLVGVFQASNLAIHTNLERAAGDDLPAAAHAFERGENGKYSAAFRSSATAVAGVLNMGRKGAVADEAARAEERALVADALGIVSNAPFMPTISNKWTKLAYDEAKKRALGEVRSSPATAGARFAAQGDELHSALEQMVIEQLVRAEYLSEKGQGDADLMSGLPPQDTILRNEHGQPVGVDFASGAFWDWYVESPLYDAINDEIVTPFKVELSE